MLIAQMPHRICFAIQCLQSNGKNGNLAPRNDVSLQVSTWTSIVSVAFDCYRFTVNSVQFCTIPSAVWQGFSLCEARAVANEYGVLQHPVATEHARQQARL